MVKYVKASKVFPDEGPDLNKPHYFLCLDNDTFLMGFDGYGDEDGEYHYEVEYWLDEDSWHFIKAYDDDYIVVEFPKDKKYAIMELMQNEMAKARGDK